MITHWCVQEVKSTGCRVRIRALPYSRKPDKSLSFEWSKGGFDEGTENELKLECVTSDDCEGYYTCEILKDNKPFFSVYHCLRTAGNKLHCSLRFVLMHFLPDFRRISNLY